MHTWIFMQLKALPFTVSPIIRYCDLNNFLKGCLFAVKISVGDSPWCPLIELIELTTGPKDFGLLCQAREVSFTFTKHMHWFSSWMIKAVNPWMKAINGMLPPISCNSFCNSVSKDHHNVFIKWCHTSAISHLLVIFGSFDVYTMMLVGCTHKLIF